MSADLETHRARAAVRAVGRRGDRARAPRAAGGDPVGANWPVGEVTTHDDCSADILIDCEGFEWVTGWVLGLGRHAWIVGPDDARAAMRERIARVQAALPSA